MKKFLMILFVAITVLVISGCASITEGYKGFISPAPDVRIEKRGEESSTVWFGVFGEHNYPPYDKVATDNGITKIATLERYYKLGVFGLWITYTTIVTGN